MPTKEDGSCEYLTETADDEGHTIYSCTVYKDRPDICRIGFSRPDHVSEEAYIEWTAEICNVLQIREGLPKRYRVEPRKA